LIAGGDKIMSQKDWDEFWIGMCLWISKKSKDQSSKVGSVIVDDRKVVISIGWNGFPRGVNDDIKERHQRPIKYKFFEHAERNAIYNAAANGHKTRGCIMYTHNGFHALIVPEE
jgi:dCMP deaminase